MTVAYPYDTHPISGSPLQPAEHRKVMAVTLAIVVVLGAVFVLWYWSSTQQRSTPVSAPVVNQLDRVHAAMATYLTSAPNLATPADERAMATELVTSKSNVTDAARQAMARELEQ